LVCLCSDEKVWVLIATAVMQGAKGVTLDCQTNLSPVKNQNCWIFRRPFLLSTNHTTLLIFDIVINIVVVITNITILYPNHSTKCDSIEE
jgi:hypothetical protein